MREKIKFYFTFREFIENYDNNLDEWIKNNPSMDKVDFNKIYLEKYKYFYRIGRSSGLPEFTNYYDDGYALVNPSGYCLGEVEYYNIDRVIDDIEKIREQLKEKITVPIDEDKDNEILNKAIDIYIINNERTAEYAKLLRPILYLECPTDEDLEGDCYCEECRRKQSYINIKKKTLEEFKKSVPNIVSFLLSGIKNSDNKYEVAKLYPAPYNDTKINNDDFENQTDSIETDMVNTNNESKDDDYEIELPDKRTSEQKIKMIILNELGVIELLKEQTGFTDNVSLAKLLSLLVGGSVSYYKGMLSAIVNDIYSDSTPYKVKNIKVVIEEFKKLGVNNKHIENLENKIVEITKPPKKKDDFR